MMTTRYWAGLAVLMLAALTAPVVAQDTAMVNQDTAMVSQDTGTISRDTIELTRAEIQAQRQNIVQELMELTPEESQRFWPVYREYRTAMAKVTDEKVMLATEYINSYDTMSDQQAEDLLKNWFKLREKHISVQKDYVGRFRKVLPAQKVARFYQIENALDAIISANLQANMPMMP